MKEEIDARRPTDNPVRDNFQYQTVKSYMCTNCREIVLKRQEDIGWFVSVPRRQEPMLQDALRLSMQPDRRELLCQHCRHDECRVTTKISQLPRALILQLNRFRKEVEEGDPKAPAGLPTLLRCQQGVLRSKASLRGLYDIRHRHPDVQFLMTSHLNQGCPENLLVLTACC
ncbi:Ubiquitin carboxyl-terminal hydrolase 37 [Amphibalanus amphitrite]|uniref:Ubiquitin carboxyl-terminal hydrolase 37 n=1 Tax=Amphibalanus amphitrite TaxID=1232801 RepID=A0A6A4VRW6_AMPAM|nr:Ubiquitin carboxyl-terminal hydrolase 37 [Amphibalanus amphitrite]